MNGNCWETSSIEAYDAFLKGWDHLNRHNPELTVKSFSYFEKAIELDPNYGRAYAGLAHAYFVASISMLHPYLDISFQETRLRMRHYLQLALKNPTPLAHGFNANQIYRHERRYEEAIAEVELAMSLEPKNAEINRSMARVLTAISRPEAIDYTKRALRIDPGCVYWAEYARGVGYLALGQLEEALTALERARKYNPKLLWVLNPLAVVYANLGRNEEARSTLKPSTKFYVEKGWDNMDLKSRMYWHPFKDKEVEKNYANGLIIAGFPGKSGDYYKIYTENRLTGEKIKNLAFAHTVTGFDIYSGKQWRIERAKGGDSTYRGPKGWVKGEASKVEETSDIGKSWIEGDRLCSQWDNLYGGFADCLTIYSNPEGAPEKKDNYIGVSVYGYVPFSVVD